MAWKGETGAYLRSSRQQDWPVQWNFAFPSFYLSWPSCYQTLKCAGDQSTVTCRLQLRCPAAHLDHFFPSLSTSTILEATNLRTINPLQTNPVLVNRATNPLSAARMSTYTMDKNIICSLSDSQKNQLVAAFLSIKVLDLKEIKVTTKPTPRLINRQLTPA